jgi:hypothetical protein
MTRAQAYIAQVSSEVAVIGARHPCRTASEPSPPVGSGIQALPKLVPGRTAYVRKS